MTFFFLHLPWTWISVVRFDAVFYGPVGGAHCLLKWCFNVPAVAMAVVYTKHRACERGRESWRRRTTRGGSRDTDVWMCFAIASGRKLTIKAEFMKTTLLTLHITSRIIQKLLKTRRCIVIHQFQSKLWIFHCWIWQGLLVLINHIPAVRCWSSEEEAWNMGNRVDSEDYS